AERELLVLRWLRHRSLRLREVHPALLIHRILGQDEKGAPQGPPFCLIPIKPQRPDLFPAGRHAPSPASTTVSPEPRRCRARPARTFPVKPQRDRPRSTRPTRAPKRETVASSAAVRMFRGILSQASADNPAYSLARSRQPSSLDNTPVRSR